MSKNIHDEVTKNRQEYIDSHQEITGLMTSNSNSLFDLLQWKSIVFASKMAEFDDF